MNTPEIFTNKKDIPENIFLLDTVDSSMRELLIVRNPRLKSSTNAEIEYELEKFKKRYTEETIYTYLPWKNIVVKMLGENDYLELRTARNKNIIKDSEQKLYRDAHVGVVGLSVGSNVLNALVFSGGPKKLKIADGDVIETTNLNRLRASLASIGQNKAEFAAKQVWELDPFAEIEIWDKGISTETLEKFILTPKLDIFIDEMDSLDLKIKSRIICKKNKVPVIMVTDNGDNIILDIERFDTDPDREILHGLIEDIDPDQLKELPYSEWVKIATKIVDPNNLTERMSESLKEIGKTIAAVPQLGTTATIAGAVASCAVRKIANNENMPSGRYVLGMDYLKKII